MLTIITWVYRGLIFLSIEVTWCLKSCADILFDHRLNSTSHSLENLSLLENSAIKWPYPYHPTFCPSAPQAYQCLISHFLASLGACNLILYIHVWWIDSCQNSVLLTSIAWPYRGLRYWPTEFECFWRYPLTSCYFSNDRRLKFNVFKMHMKEVVFMSRTFKMLISNWPRTRKFNRLLHLHAGKAISYCHALITLYVQYLCSDWSKFDRWVHAENLYSVW